jgi:hypothetical protein
MPGAEVNKAIITIDATKTSKSSPAAVDHGEQISTPTGGAIPWSDFYRFGSQAWQFSCPSVG